MAGQSGSTAHTQYKISRGYLQAPMAPLFKVGTGVEFYLNSNVSLANHLLGTPP